VEEEYRKKMEQKTTPLVPSGGNEPAQSTSPGNGLSPIAEQELELPIGGMHLLPRVPIEYTRALLPSDLSPDSPPPKRPAHGDNDDTQVNLADQFQQVRAQESKQATCWGLEFETEACVRITNRVLLWQGLMPTSPLAAVPAPHSWENTLALIITNSLVQYKETPYTSDLYGKFCVYALNLTSKALQLRPHGTVHQKEMLGMLAYVWSLHSCLFTPFDETEASENTHKAWEQLVNGQADPQVGFRPPTATSQILAGVIAQDRRTTQLPVPLPTERLQIAMDMQALVKSLTTHTVSGKIMAIVMLNVWRSVARRNLRAFSTQDLREPIYTLIREIAVEVMLLGNPKLTRQSSRKPSPKVSGPAACIVGLNLNVPHTDEDVLRLRTQLPQHLTSVRHDLRDRATDVLITQIDKTGLVV
jgi:hypothetical protein